MKDSLRQSEKNEDSNKDAMIKLRRSLEALDTHQWADLTSKVAITNH